MASYQVETEGGTYQVDTEDPSYMEDVATNAEKELSSLPGQLPGMVKAGLGIASAPADAFKAIPEMIGGKSLSETSIAEDLSPAIQGNKQTVNTIENPVESFRQAPINTAMTAAGLLGGAGMIKGEMAGRPPAPSVETPPSPASPLPPDSAGAIPKIEVPPEQAPPIGASDATNLKNPIQDKANEVKNYVSRGYEGFAKKPGAIADVADWVQSKSQMAAAEQMGATPLQARQIGHEGMRAIGQYAIDHDIVSPTVGIRGMRLKNTELLSNAGKTLGDLRKAADSVRNPLETPIDTLQAVRQKLDPEYLSGTRPGSNEYQMALKNIEKSDPSFEGMAKTATKLNHLANEANRLNQPHGPYTDVANEMSRINNERIKQILGPQKAAQYDQALKEYGVNKKISEFLKRKEGGEVKRLGPGSLTSNLVQKGLDEFGYKTAAKVGNKLSTSILKNPSLAKSLPSLFKEFIHQVEDTGHEVTGMSQGGIVGSDIGEYVQRHSR